MLKLRQFITGLVCLLVVPISAVNSAELESIGSFDFPTSGSPAAQEHFLRGVGYLHSFGWVQARHEFRLAQEVQPDFAMAYWGEAFTYNHPLLAEWEPDAPAEVLNRLGDSTEERLAKAPTEREKGFVRAAEAYAFTPPPVGQRRTAWMLAMRDLYDAFPEDREVQAFYAVSLISAATAAGDQRDRFNMLAGSLALELFRENENHPGAAHYIIHAFDDPVHAPIALAAAKKYAEIAPAVAHARHMPTHIFIQHGMWEEVAQWNESSFQAAQELWQPGDRPNDLNHSSDWGQYGDLQLANYDRAQVWIERARQVAADNPGDARSADTVRTLQARFIIETGRWHTTPPVTDGMNAHELLATGLGAAYQNDLDSASQAADRLAEMAEGSPDNTNLKISQLLVAGLAKYREAFAHAAHGMSEAFAPARQEGLEMLAEAVRLDETRRLPNGAPNPLKPAHELAGEILLQDGQHGQAAALFQQSLLRMPNRPWSLLGLARSYVQMGDEDAAAEAYQQLLAVWGDKNELPEVIEANRGVGPTQAADSQTNNSQ
ncbi:MAG: tetratricopeptide repeat protein [Pseudohongiellaceae bacterium]